MAESDNQTGWWTSAGTVRRGMTVRDANGAVLGTVDHLENDEIHLADATTPGARSFVVVSQIDGIDGETVLLSDRGDATFGEGAQP